MKVPSLYERGRNQILVRQEKARGRSAADLMCTIDASDLARKKEVGVVQGWCMETEAPGEVVSTPMFFPILPLKNPPHP